MRLLPTLKLLQRIFNLYIYIFVYMYICIYLYKYICICVYVYKCEYVSADAKADTLATDLGTAATDM